MKPYKLMCSLFAHTSDVKSLAPTRDDGGFVSVSRDLSAKLWLKNNESNQYANTQTITTHKKYVNSVVVVYSLEEYPNGLIITGSNDQSIAIHDIESNTPIAQLNEHQGAVCTLYFNPLDNLLYSGSFDASTKIWNLNNLVKSDFKLGSSMTLAGHEFTVWCVLGVDKQGVILTASADKTIKHWQLSGNKREADDICIYTGHTDCVRGLTLNTNNKQEFFSCANDGYVIHWRLGMSTPLRKFRVCDSFLYSIHMLNYAQMPLNSEECYFTTSSEDRAVRVHHSSAKTGMSTVQTLSLPCQTVWNALCLPNGDLGAACSDGTIRVFTQNEQVVASAQEQAEYEQELSRFAIPLKSDQTLSQINRDDLPGLEALAIPGRMEGQPLMISNNNEIEVYQWDSLASKWTKIGVAVGSSDAAGGSSSKKVTYLGKEYDYVFDIELDDIGGQKLKLPYNLNENPYLTAQNFIHQNELSQYFLDQIAQFIIKNTEGQTISAADTSSQAYDPFTGGNRYVPPTSYTNGRNGHQSNGKPSTYGATDPFTGSSAYCSSTTTAPTSTPTTTSSSAEYYPHLNFLNFDQKNLDALFKKLRELQQQVSVDVKSDLISNKSNLELLENLMNHINDSNTGNEINDQIDLLFQMIDVWPKESVFPLLDLTRILVLSKNTAEYIFRNQSIEYLVSKKQQTSSNYYYDILFRLLSEDNLTNSMLVIRIICNLFKPLESSAELNTNKKLLSFMLNERVNLLNRLQSVNRAVTNKNYQIAFSTLVLNYVILFKKLVGVNENFSGTYVTDMLFEMIEFMNNPDLTNAMLTWDSEAIFRMLVTIGNLVSHTDQVLDYDYLRTVLKSVENFYLICKQISGAPQRYADKVVKCASCLVQSLV